ncbi:hypothetical protein [Natranaerobius thermophilus]|nr:hypothetical protein [Natranaerobius thermophilus]
MATSSFNKDFKLNSKKTVKSFEKMMANPAKSIKINRDLVSPENERRGEDKLKQILRRSKD